MNKGFKRSIVFFPLLHKQVYFSGLKRVLYNQVNFWDCEAKST